MNKKLKERREQLGLSQSKLAILTGCLTAGLVSDFERGVRVPWPKAKRKLAHVLQCSERDIWPDGES